MLENRVVVVGACGVRVALVAASVVVVFRGVVAALGTTPPVISC